MSQQTHRVKTAWLWLEKSKCGLLKFDNAKLPIQKINSLLQQQKVFHNEQLLENMTYFSVCKYYHRFLQSSYISVLIQHVYKKVVP